MATSRLLKNKMSSAGLLQRVLVLHSCKLFACSHMYSLISCGSVPVGAVESEVSSQTLFCNAFVCFYMR